MNLQLFPHQLDAVRRMHNGCVLYGKVGCGKSRTALAYTYVCELGGSLKINGKGEWKPVSTPKDIYIITTAKKRDTHEWEDELGAFLIPDTIKITIDSWNNIQKYKKVYGAMFIFDEQRVVGKGAWVKAFLNITRKNHWILLTATPGDTWSDYIPVMIANGYYKNRTEFNNMHVIYKPYMKYPSIDHYVGTKLLKKIASQILVTIEYENKAKRVEIYKMCSYDKEKYKRVIRDRWDIYENCPIEETAKLCYLLRRVSNDDISRYLALEEIIETKTKVIVFYNFTYELNGLRAFFKEHDFEIGEWNGENHTDLPTGDRWAYLVQYSAGSEGWNCTETDTIIFFSQNYSYKTTEQAAGRIDRANTPFTELYYYYLICKSPIDVEITKALKMKQNFNENMFMKGYSLNGTVNNRRAS